MIKVYLILIILSVFGSLVYYTNNLQTKLEAANQNVVKLQDVAETSAQTIQSLKKDLARQSQLSEELSGKLLMAESQKTELLQKLQRHDLAKLSLAKPKLIEDRINAATAKVFTDLERITSE
jgi:hypothetical protein